MIGFVVGGGCLHFRDRFFHLIDRNVIIHIGNGFDGIFHLVKASAAIADAHAVQPFMQLTDTLFELIQRVFELRNALLHRILKWGFVFESVIQRFKSVLNFIFILAFVFTRIFFFQMIYHDVQNIFCAAHFLHNFVFRQRLADLFLGENPIELRHIRIFVDL